MKLSMMFSRSEAEIERWTDGFRETAASLGLTFGRSQITFNTRLAQELGLWAIEEGKGHEFHMATFKKGLGEGNNIALKDVLLNIVESVGLSVSKASEVMEKRLFKDAVEKEWELSRSMGINAVPTIIVGTSKIIGTKPYEEIVDLLKKEV